MKQTPVRVTFHLKSPIIVPIHGIHLDGLLAYVISELKKEEGENEESINEAVKQLPIGKTAGEKPVWMASQILLSPSQGVSLVAIRKRSDIQDYAAANREFPGLKFPRKLNTSSGPWKGFDMRFTTQWCKTGEAWAMATDIERLEELLGEVDHLGKLGKNGYGAISKYEVNVDTAAAENWRRRSFPETTEAKKLVLPKHIQSTGTWTFPYYKREDWERIWAYPETYLPK